MHVTYLGCFMFSRVLALTVIDITAHNTVFIYKFSVQEIFRHAQTSLGILES
jgi:hypothetical protein